MLRREQLVPNSHALRLIKRSAARHKVCKARHASSWNSRPVTPKKKFRVRKNETKRFGNKQTTSNQNNNNNNNQSTQPHSNTNNAMTKIQRARKKKPPSFEEMLRSEIPLRRQNKSNNNHNQNTNQNKKTSSRRISTSAYTRSTQNGRIKNKRGGGGGSWTRSGMKMTTGPSRAKVANIRRKTQRPELRAKSAPSSDNKRANSRTRARTSNNSHRHRSNNQENMSENMSENISENISENMSENMSENICISENQKTTNALLAETEQDPLATTHHNFGTIDTTLLDTKRPTGEEETPGGMWGDGVGLDLSTILECSVESQSVASFLSPASQKLMQAHLRTRSRKDDHSVGDSNDTSDDDMDTNTSNIRRSSSFTSGMTTINEQISPEELAGGWRVFHQEAEEEATVNQAEYTEEEDTEEDTEDVIEEEKQNKEKIQTIKDIENLDFEIENKEWIKGKK